MVHSVGGFSFATKAPHLPHVRFISSVCVIARLSTFGFSNSLIFGIMEPDKRGSIATWEYYHQ